MTHFASTHAQASIDKESYTTYRPFHRRTRTLSLYSVASDCSRSSVIVNVVPPVAPAVKVQRGHDAWGSFVASTSAAGSLRRHVPPPLDTSARSEKQSVSSPLSGRPSPPGKRPFSPGYNSGTSSSASSIHEESSSELHPVLARLERGSKLCAQKTGCATCQKQGRDFPQCGKCKKMWCSRECRLVGGKRHICY